MATCVLALFIVIIGLNINTEASNISCNLTQCPPVSTADVGTAAFCVEFQQYFTCANPIIRECDDTALSEDDKKIFYLESSKYELFCKSKDQDLIEMSGTLSNTQDSTASRHCVDPMCHTPTEPYTDIRNCQSQRSYIACMYPYYTHCEKLTQEEKKDFYSRSNEVSKYCSGSDEAYCPADFPLQIRMCFTKLGFGILGDSGYRVKKHSDKEERFLIDLNIRNMTNVCRHKTYNEALECIQNVIKTCKDKQTIAFLNKFINIEEQRKAFVKFCSRKNDWEPHLDCIDQQNFGLSVCFQNAMLEMNNDMKHKQVDTTNNEENIEFYTQLLCRYSRQAIGCSKDAFSHCSEQAAEAIVTLLNDNISGPCGVSGCSNVTFHLSVLILSYFLLSLLVR